MGVAEEIDKVGIGKVGGIIVVGCIVSGLVAIAVGTVVAVLKLWKAVGWEGSRVIVGTWVSKEAFKVPARS